MTLPCQDIFRAYRFLKILKWIYYYYYYFYSYKEIGFTFKLEDINRPKSAKLPSLYVVTQTLEMVNVDVELDYLHLLKRNFNNYT